MPFKTDEAGNIVLAETMVEGKAVKLPVFVHKDGKEAPLDADATLATITRLNGEAMGHRQAREQAETKLQSYAQITDPAAALKALEVVKNLGDGELIKAGDVEKVKQEVAKVYTTKIDELIKANEGLVNNLTDLTLGNAFANSPVLKEKFAIPADFVQARFGGNFGVDNGKVYAVDANGQKIYSRTNPGALADFDDALMQLVEAHPQKDSFLKGTGASGGGAPAGGGGQGGGGGPKGNIGGTRDERAAAIKSRFPELANNSGG